MRGALLVLLGGCVVSRPMPPEAVCDQAVARYAESVFSCSGDADLALKRTDVLKKTYTCAVLGWNIDTGWDPTHYLLLKGDQSIRFKNAWACPEAIHALPCDDLMAADPAGPFLFALSQGCVAIFDGEGDPGTFTDPTTYSFGTTY